MSRVVVVKHAGALEGEAITEQGYASLLRAGLQALTDKPIAPEAIQSIIPRGVVGLKTNCLTGKLNSTARPLVDALGALLESSGWKANDIVVWERTNRELQKAGYELNASSFGRRVVGTDTNGVGYSEQFYSAGGSSSLISRVLESLVTTNINLPVLKDHSIAGLSGGLKNMFGAINNPNKFHRNNGDPHVAEVSMMGPIRAKNRLTIMDAVRVQYHQGPGFDQRYLKPYGGVILSLDPVAADRVGLEIVEHLRRKNGLLSLSDSGRPATYLNTAEQLGLGVATLTKIDLRVIVADDKGKARPGELL